MVVKMKVVLQRVLSASVTVNNEVIGKIDQGFLLLVGITYDDSEMIVKKVADKIAGLRIFTDSEDKMNLSIKDIGGKILSISQFTLYADCKKGRRPSFDQAARPEIAEPLYELFNQELRNHELCVETGLFGADMKVELLNDGPVTIIIDSKEL